MNSHWSRWLDDDNELKNEMIINEKWEYKGNWYMKIKTKNYYYAERIMIDHGTECCNWKISIAGSMSDHYTIARW